MLRSNICMAAKPSIATPETTDVFNIPSEAWASAEQHNTETQRDTTRPLSQTHPT
jgi:hypothetical protein